MSIISALSTTVEHLEKRKNEFFNF